MDVNRANNASRLGNTNNEVGTDGKISVFKNLEDNFKKRIVGENVKKQSEEGFTYRDLKSAELENFHTNGVYKQKILEDKGITKKLCEVKTKKAQKESVNRYTNEETNGTDQKIFDTTISKNYIGQAKSEDTGKGGNVSNIFEGLNIEGLNIDALSPEKVKEKSVAFVNVLSNSLESSLKKLRDSANNKNLEYEIKYKDCKGKEISKEEAQKLSEKGGKVEEEKILADTEGNKKLAEEVAKFAKLTGKLAQSFGRLVPGATMGALGNIEDEKVKKEAEEIAYKLEEISKNCGKLEGIVGKTEKEVLGWVEGLELPDNLDEMKNFAKNSFDFNNIKLNAELLAARNLSSDMKIIQFDATIIDLMESIDDFSEKKDKNGQKISLSSKDYKPEDVYETMAYRTFAKLGLLLKGEHIDKLTKKEKVPTDAIELGFKNACETREFMKKVRKSSMFSEFKYEVLVDNLVYDIADFVLRKRENENGNDKDLFGFRLLRQKIEDAKGNKEEIKELKKDLDKKLSELGLSGIKNKLEAKCKEIFGEKDRKPIYPRGGFRGRNGNLFNFAYTEKNGPYTKEAYDEFVKNVEQGSFFSEAQKLGTLDHKYQTNITSDYDAINKEFVEKIINNPASFLPDGIKLSSDEKENLQEQILNANTGCNVDKDQTLRQLVGGKLGKLEPKETLADIMKENKLRTICSVSGTTTDIVVGLVGIYGKEAMGKILEPFAKLVNEKTPNAKAIKDGLNDKKFNGFKRLFSSIASYMQCGQYHSAGEVLGGLYTASLNFIDDTERGPRTNIDSFKANFDVLCKVLSNDTDAFALAA